MPESKDCAECGATFHPTPGRSRRQWERQQCCNATCANILRARGRPRQPGDLDRSAGKAAYQLEWQRRNALPGWAAWWEARRRTEDLAELARPFRPLRDGPTCPLRDAPRIRQFIAGYCVACGIGWIDYPARQPSGYCNRCQDRRWAADSRHKRRAWKAASAVLDVVSPEVVFRRDGYRCQLCGCKTRGKYPSGRSPTIDHIVALAAGGDHSYLNVQCACFDCNSRKGSSAGNAQLRLIA